MVNSEVLGLLRKRLREIETHKAAILAQTGRYMTPQGESDLLLALLAVETLWTEFNAYKAERILG